MFLDILLKLFKAFETIIILLKDFSVSERTLIRISFNFYELCIFQFFVERIYACTFFKLRVGVSENHSVSPFFF